MGPVGDFLDTWEHHEASSKMDSPSVNDLPEGQDVMSRFPLGSFDYKAFILNLIGFSWPHVSLLKY